MILSYSDGIGHARRVVRATITPARLGAYGQPVIALSDGSELDFVQLVALDYRMVRATAGERELFNQIRKYVAMHLGRFTAVEWEIYVISRV